MNRKKLKALTFTDYILNIVLSALGFLALSWMFNFSWGSSVHGIIFTVSLFLFMYSKGALAAKIDLRENKTPMINAVKLVLPLIITLILISLVYSLVYFNIIPVGDIILKTTILSNGETVSMTLKDIASVVVRIIFLNITGFLKASPTNPFILIISPIVVFTGAFSGYYFGRNKIYMLDILTKVRDVVVKKFNE